MAVSGMPQGFSVPLLGEGEGEVYLYSFTPPEYLCMAVAELIP